jgi:adenine phosphoribosyltransferase
MTTETARDTFSSLIKDVPDYPKKGIIFKDITPLLSDAKAFAALIDEMCKPYRGKGVELVAGAESRGFLLASAMALKLSAGVMLIRKKGKLPRETYSASYSLEYGQDSIEAHQDACAPGAKVVLVDDVLATGGTAKACLDLLGKLKADLQGVSFLIELSFLKGREKITGTAVNSLISY